MGVRVRIWPPRSPVELPLRGSAICWTVEDSLLGSDPSTLWMHGRGQGGIYDVPVEASQVLCCFFTLSQLPSVHRLHGERRWLVGNLDAAGVYEGVEYGYR